MNRIDLNADLGEDETPAGIARDLAIMDVVSSCNIACGGHAGSFQSMERMLSAAKAKKVAAGAHPSYPDRDNFGRKTMAIEIEPLRKSLNRQLADIRQVADQSGTNLHHIKPHGALYNDAQDDHVLASLLVQVSGELCLPIVGMANSILQNISRENGINFISEAFIDRSYSENGRLVSRTQAGAVLTDESERLQQGIALAKGQNILTSTGQPIAIEAETLCLHSDSDDALSTAQQMRARLEQADISILAPSF